MAQQDRAVATRQAVLIAAATVFEQKGYTGCSISDILREGGVTRGALYFHFGSKQDLAHAIVAEQQAWVGQVQPKSTNPLQVAIDLSYAFIQELESSVLMRASVRLTIEQGTFEPDGTNTYQVWADQAETVFSYAQGLGQLQPGTNPRDLALLCTSAIIGIQLSATALGARKDMFRRLQTFWVSVLPGIALPEHAASVQVGLPEPVGASEGSEQAV